MLVLSRKQGQAIEIPELGVTINLLKVKGKSASLGVEAPKSIRVLRGELPLFDDRAEQPNTTHRRGWRSDLLAKQAGRAFSKRRGRG